MNLVIPATRVSWQIRALKGGSHGSQTTGRNRPQAGEALRPEARSHAHAGQYARVRERGESDRGACRGAEAVRQAPHAGIPRRVLLRQAVVGKPGWSF